MATPDLDIDYHLSKSLRTAKDAASKLAAVDKRSDAQDAALEDALADVVAITQARNAFDVRVNAEPSTYRAGGEVSWFRDIAVAGPGATMLLPGVNPDAAKRRLERNNEEQRLTRERKAQERQRIWSELSVRSPDLDAIPGDAGSQWAPPQYIIERFSSISRAAGTVLNLVPTFPGPSVGMTVSIPRFTNAGPITSPSTEGNVEDLGYTTTAEVTHPVSSFYGVTEVSMQLLQRADIDTYLSEDLGYQYVADIESQIVNGAGTGQDFLGLLNVSDITSVTYTAADPSPTDVFVNLGVLAGQTSSTRKRPVSAFVMNTNTWMWLTSSVDTTGTPFGRPGVGPALASATGSVGTLFGIAVYLSEAMPTDLGTGTNQSTVLALHTPDLLLLASDPIFDVVEEGVGANQLSAFCRFRSYASFFPDRMQGAGIGALGGTGLIVPSSWA
jgi:HK97 family phage major capsid protein